MRRLLARLVLPAVLAAGCGSHAPAPAAAPPLARTPVTLGQAALVKQPVVEEVVGTVRAVRSATLAPIVSGTVVELRGAVGTRVQAGEVLVRLSAREIDARLQQARAVYQLAKLEHERAASLKAQAALSPAQYDAALAQLHVAEAGQAEATTMADKTLLRAPFAGVVSAKLANVGDTAMPGQALLAIEATDALRFEAMVPEASARGLAPGRTVPVRLDGAPGELSATVAEVSPTADAATRSLLVKLDLPRDPAVQAGRFGRLMLSSGDKEVVLVPAAAVVRRGQLEIVFIADKDAARLRLVRTGRQSGAAVEIVSGLGAGERVVVAEAAQLVDGQPIEVRP